MLLGKVILYQFPIVKGMVKECSKNMKDFKSYQFPIGKGKVKIIKGNFEDCIKVSIPNRER